MRNYLKLANKKLVSNASRSPNIGLWLEYI